MPSSADGSSEWIDGQPPHNLGAREDAVQLDQQLVLAAIGEPGQRAPPALAVLLDESEPLSRCVGKGHAGADHDGQRAATDAHKPKHA
jgi:hypothetical protein